MEKNKIIIFFDEVCELCSRFIQFVSKRDKKKVFLFAPLQGETAKQRLDLKDIQTLNSIAVLKDGGVYREGRALKLILKNLYPYTFFLRFFLLWLNPPFFLNRVYRFIAKRRYDWFGKKEKKGEPPPDLKKSLLP